MSYRAWLLRDMAFSCPAHRRSSRSNSYDEYSQKCEMLYWHQSTWISCKCDLSQLTFDPVQPSSAKANWLMGETTRSTLTALHDSRLFSWTSQDAWWLRSSLWLWVHELDWGLVSGLMRVCGPVSECVVPGFLFSLKMEKHLSKWSMLEDGWVGRSSDSR